jgi:hypothetical protein
MNASFRLLGLLGTDNPRGSCRQALMKILLKTQAALDRNWLHFLLSDPRFTGPLTMKSEKLFVTNLDQSRAFQLEAVDHTETRLSDCGEAVEIENFRGWLQHSLP